MGCVCGGVIEMIGLFLKGEIMYEYKATVLRVVDGDTVDVDIDLGFGLTFEDQRIRFINFNAPSCRTRDKEEKRRGLEAKAFLETMIQPGDQVVLDSQEFRGDRGKYGRILGDIFTSDGVSVIDMMIRAGHRK